MFVRQLAALPKEQQQKFNYTALDPEKRIVVQQRTDEIKTLVRHTARKICEIGQKLTEVKEQLDHGQYEDWIKSEFGWQLTMAWNFRNVAQAFKSSDFEDLNISSSVLYLIATPSVPQKARQEVLKLASQGELISYKETQRIIARYKDAAKTKANKQIPLDPKTQQDRQATVTIDLNAELSEDDSAGKEAQLAEPEMRFSSDTFVSLTELDLDDAVEKDRSKEELQRKETEVENFTSGSSNSSVELLGPVTNETDNHLGQNEANDDANQAQEQVIEEKDNEIGDRLSEKLPLVNKTGNQAEQDEAKGKANQSPQSLENGTFACVAENPSASADKTRDQLSTAAEIKTQLQCSEVGSESKPEASDPSKEVLNQYVRIISIEQENHQQVEEGFQTFEIILPGFRIVMEGRQSALVVLFKQMQNNPEFTEKIFRQAQLAHV